MNLARRWRSNATANKNRDTRTQGLGVRELRQTRRHTHASQAEEEKTAGKAEAEQAKRLAFSLTAPLAFRSLSLLTFPSEAIPCEATASYLRTQDSEAFRIRQFAPVVAKCLFVEVSEQVEGLHADVGAVQLAFNEAPKVFHRVGVDVAVYVLHGVVNDRMAVIVRQAIIGLERIGEQRGTSSYVLADMFVQFMFAARWYREGTDLAATFHHSESDSLIFSSGPGNDTRTTFTVHVSRLAADKGLVNLDLPGQLRGGLILHDFADALKHKPCGLLSDTQVFGYFARTNSVFTVGYQPHSRKPFVQADGRLVKHRANLNRELLTALRGATLPNATAGKEHRFPCGAIGTLHTVRPTLRRKVSQRVVRISEVNNRFSQCFRGVHEQSMP